MTTREILIAARALIDAPEKWTQGAFARNSEMFGVSPKSPQAVCFCAIGALRAVEHDIDQRMEAQRALGVREVTDFNDTHTHAEVLAMFDEAIARLDRGEV